MVGNYFTRLQVFEGSAPELLRKLRRSKIWVKKQKLVSGGLGSLGQFFWPKSVEEASKLLNLSSYVFCLRSHGLVFELFRGPRFDSSSQQIFYFYFLFYSHTLHLH